MKENPRGIGNNGLEESKKEGINFLSDAWWRSNTIKVLITSSIGIAAVIISDEIPQETTSKVVQWCGVAETAALTFPLAGAWSEKARQVCYIKTCELLGVIPKDSNN